MLSFPLSLEDFADGLRTVSFNWDLSENRKVTQTGGGELLVSDLGPRLWQGSVAVAPHTHNGQRRAQALAQALRQGAGSFMIGDPKGQFPQSDSDGTILGSTVVSLSAPVAGSSTVSLAGLPAGYVITPGDYLSFEYGSPARYALHQVVVGGTSNGTDALSVSVVSSIRPGATDGAPVRLVRPFCKAIVVPGSFKSGTIGLAATSGFSFQFRQTMR